MTVLRFSGAVLHAFTHYASTDLYKRFGLFMQDTPLLAERADSKDALVLPAYFDQAREAGLLSAYQQVCFVMAQLFAPDFKYSGEFVQLIRIGLQLGIDEATFKKAHQWFAGQSMADWPFFESENEPDGLDLLPVYSLAFAVAGSPIMGERVLIECDEKGFKHKLSVGLQGGYASPKQMEWSLVNPVVGALSVPALSDIEALLIEQASLLMPKHPRTILPNGQLGVYTLSAMALGLPSRYLPKTPIVLLDTRQSSDTFTLDALANAGKPTVNGSIVAKWGWSQSIFKLAVKPDLKLLMNQEPFFLVLGGVQVQVTIHPESDLVSTTQAEKLCAQGELPIGSPVIHSEQSVPLLAQILPVVQVGKGVISLQSNACGTLKMTMDARIHPANLQLGFEVTLECSPLTLAWVSRSALSGETQGKETISPTEKVFHWESPPVILD